MRAIRIAEKQTSVVVLVLSAEIRNVTLRRISQCPWATPAHQSIVRTQLRRAIRVCIQAVI